MPKLSKTVLANTFKLDCDRYLRFRLASDAEREELHLKEYDLNRPGPRLMIEAGRHWEAAKYQDLIDIAGPGRVVYRKRDTRNPESELEPFDTVANLFDVLKAATPPVAILEAEFAVPTDFAPGLADVLKAHGIEPARARPDILWIRPYPTGFSLIAPKDSTPEYEIHIVDVKMAAEPSVKHFAEVTFYAMALARALEGNGLAGRYAVSAQGYVWPGNHDIQHFRTLARRHESEGAADPLAAALSETLVAVPHEVYRAHVRQFFADRLPRVLKMAPTDASWHIVPKCQLCDYLGFCKQQAKNEDNLCRIPWLNHGQADLLRAQGITTTRQLGSAIYNKSEAWNRAAALSQSLRAEAPAFYARDLALREDKPRLIPGRVCAAMPRYVDMSIYLTIHFDPGSGITFAMGASRVYWKRDREPGAPPIKESATFIVDRAEDMNPATERLRLCEMVRLVYDWFMEADTHNKTAGKRDKASVQVFLWDRLELRQLRRMLERHMEHPDTQDALDLILRLFPPDSMLPDVDAFKSQPYTVVKEVFRQLVGLPLPHDYTLLETADLFHPRLKDDGTPWKARRQWGFLTDLSDQIPFERGYELWVDKINLRHWSADRKPGRPYTRDEVYAGIKDALSVRLNELDHVVSRLRDKSLPYAEKLVLRKDGFCAKPTPKMRVPERARRVVAFEKLNAIVGEMENRDARAMPIDEREARFLSIRGIVLAPEPAASELIARARRNRPRYAGEELLAFHFAPTSVDAKVKEGDFLMALSNEDAQMDLDMPWYRHLNESFEDAKTQVHSLGESSLLYAKLRRLLGVEVALLDVVGGTPALVLRPATPEFFRFAEMKGLLDLSRPMVLDPLFQDFHTEHIRGAMKDVGGEAPSTGKKK